jgi:hypothetical protein
MLAVTLERKTNEWWWKKLFQYDKERATSLKYKLYDMKQYLGLWLGWEGYDVNTNALYEACGLRFVLYPPNGEFCTLIILNMNSPHHEGYNVSLCLTKYHAMKTNVTGKIKPIHSWTRHWMDMSDQLHASEALMPAPIQQEALWAPWNRSDIMATKRRLPGAVTLFTELPRLLQQRKYQGFSHG